MCSSELYIGHNYIQDIIKYIQDIIIYRTELYIGQNYIQDRILKVGLHILYTRTRNTSLTINNIEINKIIPLLLLIVNLRHIYLVLTSNKCFTNLFLFILLYPEPVKMLVSCGVPQFVHEVCSLCEYCTKKYEERRPSCTMHQRKPREFESQPDPVLNTVIVLY